ncbi:hypothetical protein [Prosthecobacter fusiformis]|uniref:hypothetical protein n=1 Tax=Prosthecobacter fusiformis TaxID=48464 RepID=UPI001414D6CE|nr:hypothetical protein [Prosthecobacter fusiformis]
MNPGRPKLEPGRRENESLRELSGLRISSRLLGERLGVEGRVKEGLESEDVGGRVNDGRDEPDEVGGRVNEGRELEVVGGRVNEGRDELEELGGRETEGRELEGVEGRVNEGRDDPEEVGGRVIEGRELEDVEGRVNDGRDELEDVDGRVNDGREDEEEEGEGRDIDGLDEEGEGREMEGLLEEEGRAWLGDRSRLDSSPGRAIAVRGRPITQAPSSATAPKPRLRGKVFVFIPISDPFLQPAIQLHPKKTIFSQKCLSPKCPRNQFHRSLQPLHLIGLFRPSAKVDAKFHAEKGVNH